MISDQRSRKVVRGRTASCISKIKENEVNYFRDRLQIVPIPINSSILIVVYFLRRDLP